MQFAFSHFVISRNRKTSRRTALGHPFGIFLIDFSFPSV